MIDPIDSAAMRGARKQAKAERQSQLNMKILDATARIKATGAYTIEEIDMLRVVLRSRYCLHSNLQSSVLEDRVRTAMAARITPWRVERPNPMTRRYSGIDQ